MPALVGARRLQTLGALGTGGGSVQPLGAFVINGVPMVIASVPMQKAS